MKRSGYIILRRFPEALRKLDQVLNITPDDTDTVALKAAILRAEGELPQASALLAPLRPTIDDPFLIETQAYQGILERHPEQIIARLEEILAKPDPALGFYNGELRFWLGWAQEVAGDNVAARATWLQARSELEPFLQTQPENFALMEDLALISMGLGDKAAAFALAERARAVNPTEKDAMYGPFSTEIIARIEAGLGDPDRAVAALNKLLSIPYRGPLVWVHPITPASLQLDPMFDPLRSNPRFQKLVATPESSKR
jgi:tetratricopeptide (TPR) repeat protein